MGAVLSFIHHELNPEQENAIPAGPEGVPDRETFVCHFGQRKISDCLCNHRLEGLRKERREWMRAKMRFWPAGSVGWVPGSKHMVDICPWSKSMLPLVL